jgi:hypothetical protein
MVTNHKKNHTMIDDDKSILANREITKVSILNDSRIPKTILTYRDLDEPETFFVHIVDNNDHLRKESIYKYLTQRSTSIVLMDTLEIHMYGVLDLYMEGYKKIKQIKTSNDSYNEDIDKYQ